MTITNVVKIEDHLTWAEVVASKFRWERNIPMEHEEVVSLAMAGLMVAAKNHRQEKGSFRTYAWLRIRAELNNSIKQNMAQKRRGSTISLEDIYPGHLPSVNGTEKRLISKDLVKWILDSVEFNQAYALERYYLDDLSMREIGEEMGVTLTRVSQILAEGRERANKKWVREING